MYVLLTLLLLLLAIITIVMLRIVRPSTSFAWLAATLGALLAWISVFAWQFDLPHRYILSDWLSQALSPVGLFRTAPELLVDVYGWLYALSLAALGGAVVFTSPARTASPLNPASWAGTLALTVLGLLAVLADNPLTLVLLWTAIDLVEFFNTLRASDTASLSERAVISFSIRAIGTGFALWASVLSALGGQTFLFENATHETGIILLLAAGLRLGVLPLHLAYRSEIVLRRGFGTTLRMVTAATSLILLARLPFSAMDAVYMPFLLGFVVVAALYSGWQWLWARDELSGRPYWIIGMSALSLAATLRGSSAGSAAWGTAMLLFGGISFLYSARHVWFTRILACIGLLMLGLPFTLTATGWEGAFPWSFLFWPLFVIAHILLVAGYIRHLFQPGEATFSELPTWAQTAYPVGLSMLAFTIVLAGLWGWPGAMQLGAWWVAAILLLLAGLLVVGIWRFQRFSPRDISLSALPALQTTPGIPMLMNIQDFLAGLLWRFYRNLGHLFTYLANLLEGDGGLLWTLLLLVLFVIFLRGR